MFPCLALGTGADELAEVGGGGVVLLDVGLCQLTVLGIAGGDVGGYVEVRAGVGGGFALAELGDVLEFLLDIGEEAGGGFFIAQEMGADEHEGQEVALHGSVGVWGVPLLEEGTEGVVVGVVTDFGALAADPALEDVEELLLGGCHEGGMDILVGDIEVGDEEVLEGDVEEGHLHLQFHDASAFALDGHEFVGGVLDLEGGAHEGDGVTWLQVIEQERHVQLHLLIATGTLEGLHVLLGDACMVLGGVAEEEGLSVGASVPLHDERFQFLLVALDEEVTTEGGA